MAFCQYIDYQSVRNHSTVGGYKTFRFGQSVELPHVKQPQVGLDASLYYGLAAHFQVKVYYAELVKKTVHQREKTGRKDVYSGKGEPLTGAYIQVGIRAFNLACLNVCPAYETHFIVEKQVTFSLTLADKQSGVTALMAFVQPTEVYIAQYVYVVDKYRSVRRKQRGGLFSPPPVSRSISDSSLMRMSTPKLPLSCK